VETHIAKTDAALLASITVVMLLMGRAYLAPAQFTATQALGYWLALGAGVQLKGPIAPIVPLLAGITLLVVDRRAPWFGALRPVWGVPLMIACAAPWFIAIGIATEGRFFSEAIGDDMLSKVGSGEESHWGPPGFYTFLFGITAFPSAWIVLRALPGAWADRLKPQTRFLLGWAVPVWLLFEAVATKLPHYALPAYPALMLLAAAWALDPLRRPTPRWLAAIGWLALGGVALGLPIAAMAAAFYAEKRVDIFGLIGLGFGAALILVLWRAAHAGQWARAALLGAMLSVPVYAAVLEGVIPRLQSVWVSPRLAAEVRAIAPGLRDRDFGVVGYHEPSLQFALGGGIALLRDGAAAAEFLAEKPGRVVAVSHRQEAAFRAAAAERGITPRDVGSVTGLNYVRGRWLTLLIFKVD
jgi:4-amino-4-deoxy-L-arabinose transferase-like glycosyltransferase